MAGKWVISMNLIKLKKMCSMCDEEIKEGEECVELENSFGIKVFVHLANEDSDGNSCYDLFNEDVIE